MKFIYLLLISLAITGCAGQNKMHSAGIEEIIYKKKNTTVLDVFNTKKLYFSNEDVEYLSKRNFKYGEFGGEIEFCSNDEFYCLAGGISISIPKKLTGQKEWSFNERDCQTESPLSDQHSAIITCKFKQWSTRFVYSPNQGITSYIRSSAPSFEYELVDEKGLFANPSSNTISHEATHKVN